jgi:hypothetical protein
MTSPVRADRYNARPLVGGCFVTGCDHRACRIVRSTSDERTRAVCIKCFRLMTEFTTANWQPAG